MTRERGTSCVVQAQSAYKPKLLSMIAVAAKEEEGEEEVPISRVALWLIAAVTIMMIIITRNNWCCLLLQRLEGKAAARPCHSRRSVPLPFMNGARTLPSLPATLPPPFQARGPPPPSLPSSSLQAWEAALPPSPPPFSLRCSAGLWW